MVVDLGNKKRVSNDESSSKLTYLYHTLPMRIVETMENYVYHSEINIIIRKMSNFSCSIDSMNNKYNSAKN